MTDRPCVVVRGCLESLVLMDVGAVLRWMGDAVVGVVAEDAVDDVLVRMSPMGQLAHSWAVVLARESTSPEGCSGPAGGGRRWCCLVSTRECALARRYGFPRIASVRARAAESMLGWLGLAG